MKQHCIIAASDLVSVCHKALESDKVGKIVELFFSFMSKDSIRETALKGLTLIALHETSDLRARSNNSNTISVASLTGGIQRSRSSTDGNSLGR